MPVYRQNDELRKFNRHADYVSAATKDVAS